MKALLRSPWEAPAFLVAVAVPAVAVVLVTGMVSAPLAVVAILLGLPGLLAAPVALRQGLRMFAGLRRRLCWWHYCWMLLPLSSLSFRTRAVEQIQNSPVDGWAAVRMGLVTLAGLWMLARIDLGKVLRSGTRGLMLPLAIYSAISVASSLWSVFPAWTGYKAFEYLMDMALISAILVVARNLDDMKSFYDWAWVLTTAELVTVWIGLVLWPSEAIMHGIGTVGVQIIGVVPSLSANGVGDTSALVSLVCATRLLFAGPRNRVFYSMLLGAALVTLLFSQTRSAALGFTVGIGVVLLAVRRYSLVATLLVIGCFALAYTNAARMVETYMARDQSPELIMSLSGRTGWWEFAWQRFEERPILGYGAYAAGRFVAMAGVGAGTTSSLHNAYLEVLLGVGLLGLVPFLIAVYGLWFKLLTIRPPPESASLGWQLKVEALGIMAMLTARSIFTSNIIWHASVDFLAVLALVECMRRLTPRKVEVSRWAARRRDPVLAGPVR